MAILNFWSAPRLLLGRRGRDGMVVGYITTYAISAYHHLRCEFESRSGEVYSYNILWYSLSVTCHRSVVFSGYSNKTYHHDITEILLKMALNIINHTKPKRVMDLFLQVMKRLYVCVLPLNYATLDYHSIAILCFRYNESAGVSSSFTSIVHCFGRFFGRSFGLSGLRGLLGPSDYRADTVALRFSLNLKNYTISSFKWMQIPSQK
jgi:hypothetical protein